MTRTAAITTTCLTLAAIALAAWAVAWPLDLPTVDIKPAAAPKPASSTDSVIATLPPPDSFTPIWERRWQTWQPVRLPTPAELAAQKAAAEAAAQAAAAPTDPPPPGYRFIGAILDPGHSFGFFATPTGQRYAAVGQKLGREPDAPTVVAIEHDRAILKISDRQYQLPLERTTTRLTPRSSPPQTTPAPILYSNPAAPAPAAAAGAPPEPQPAATTATFPGWPTPLGRREIR
jgi:hypothetical protein